MSCRCGGGKTPTETMASAHLVDVHRDFAFLTHYWLVSGHSLVVVVVTLPTTCIASKKRLVDRGCSGCTDPVCDGAKCGLCAVEADSSEHIFSTCAALFRTGIYGSHLVPARNIDLHNHDNMAYMVIHRPSYSSSSQVTARATARILAGVRRCRAPIPLLNGSVWPAPVVVVVGSSPKRRRRYTGGSGRKPYRAKESTHLLRL
jgi:hypothetical protein